MSEHTVALRSSQYTGDCDSEGAGDSELDDRAGDVSGCLRIRFLGWRFLGRPRLLSSDEL